MKRLIVLALAVSVRVAAQTPAPLTLIPYPREVNSSGASVRLTGVAISAGSEADDLSAAAIFGTQLAERGIQIDGSAAWKVELIRVDSPEGARALSAARMTFDRAMRDEGYVLISDANGARVIGATSAGVFYGLQTLAQLFNVTSSGPVVRTATIRDWPAMAWRGVHDDLSRGPVPTLEYQKRQIRTAAAFKINVWSPYYEHTLEYKSHPLIAIPGGSMSQDDVKQLVTYAAKYHVTIVPEQEAFGHLHHVLKNEAYSSLGETAHGHVLAPADPGSMALIKDMFTEINALFPGPFIHLGADETFELGRGRTKSTVDSLGLGRVYLGFLKDIDVALKPITKQKKLLFWGDVAGGSPQLVPTLPKDMIAVAWGYGATEIGDRGIKPFRDAGMETWVAPGVTSWNRVWPNFGTALSNIRLSARTGQFGGSTGLLNTVWDDDGDAIFEEVWYGVLFGAAEAWQADPNTDRAAAATTRLTRADSLRIQRFQSSYGLAFHGDTTGLIDAAQRSLIAAHAALTRGRSGDGGNALFFMDPWNVGDDTVIARLRPVLPEVRIHAESALVMIAKAREQVHLREKTALDAMELGARRLDWLAAKFLYSDMIASAFARAAADSANGRRYLQDIMGMNGTMQDMRDGFSLTRDLFERAWKNENRPYWMTNATSRFDAEIIRWIDRSKKMDELMRRWTRDRIMPKAEDMGIPKALLLQRTMQ